MKKLFCVLLVLCLLLCGCGKKEATTSDGLTAEQQAVLSQRRDTAEAYMRQMMSVLWTTDVDIVYSTDVSSMGTDADDEEDVLHLMAGRLYSGMPYTHGSGSGDSFFSFGQPDENGIYQITGLSAAMLSGGGGTKPNNMARISNDCADAVFWAWSRVGNSFSFTITANMTASRGCLPVGQYTTEDQTYKKTKSIVQDNGEKVMYDAYAQLQKADAVVTYNGAGHAMMVSEVNVVQTDGRVDCQQSYVLVHEQFTGNYRNGLTYVDEATDQTVYCLGGVDRKYTFADLYKKGYLPVTIQELVDPAPVVHEGVTDSLDIWDITAVTSGNLTCLDKFSMVTVTITAEDGSQVQQATCFVRESERFLFHMDAFGERSEKEVMRGALDLSLLPQGKYHCKTDCVLGTGEMVTVRDFDFEKK